MSNTIKWGIIGCGGIARKFALCTSHVDEAELCAVASATPGKAEKFAQQFGVESAYADYGQLVQRDDIQAVYVATTHNFHYENVKLALEHGKAVLCEKPITVAAWEAEELIALARRQKVFLMEGMWTRFLPAICQVRDWLSEGAIGELRQIRADFGFNAPFNPEGRMFNKALAGGALLDAGIYPVSLASMVAGSPVAVEAIADIGSTGVDEQSFYLLRYENGAIASLSASVRAPVDVVAEFIGSKGKITVPRFLAASSAELHRYKEGETIQRSFPYPDGQGFEYEIQEVVDCMRQGKLESEVMPLDETLAIMRTMDTIRGKLGLVFDNDK
ncbi:MAG: gfo/Idh/MocA family oxidoreductase [Candidatus Latescibacteria bacterium]|nr:gfo/Idh/MocA family oxidoreductase [Candidatus Latescibacterota bacterium]